MCIDARCQRNKVCSIKQFHCTLAHFGTEKNTKKRYYSFILFQLRCFFRSLNSSLSPVHTVDRALVFRSCILSVVAQHRQNKSDDRPLTIRSQSDTRDVGCWNTAVADDWELDHTRCLLANVSWWWRRFSEISAGSPTTFVHASLGRIFTARCYAERGYASAKSSVCLSVTFRYMLITQVGILRK